MSGHWILLRYISYYSLLYYPLWALIMCSLCFCILELTSEYVLHVAQVYLGIICYNSSSFIHWLLFCSGTFAVISLMVGAVVDKGTVSWKRQELAHAHNMTSLSMLSNMTAYHEERLESIKVAYAMSVTFAVGGMQVGSGYCPLISLGTRMALKTCCFYTLVYIKKSNVNNSEYNTRVGISQCDSVV